MFEMFFIVSNNLFLDRTLKVTTSQEFIQFSVVVLGSLDTSAALPLYQNWLADDFNQWWLT